MYSLKNEELVDIELPNSLIKVQKKIEKEKKKKENPKVNPKNIFGSNYKEPVKLFKKKK